MWLRIKQFFCRHRRTHHSSGFDHSEVTCLDCGLRDGVLGRDYGFDGRSPYLKGTGFDFADLENRVYDEQKKSGPLEFMKAFDRAHMTITGRRRSADGLQRQYHTKECISRTRDMISDEILKHQCDCQEIEIHDDE